jgi:Mg2+-importing ATPase
LLAQLLVVLVLLARTLPWQGQRAARIVVLVTAITAVAGLLLPVGPLAAALNMTPPPPTYSFWLLAVTAAYALAAQLVKNHYVSRHQARL